MFQEWLNAHTYTLTQTDVKPLTRANTHTHLNSDRAVHSLEDLGVVDGVDLNEQGQTVGHCDGKDRRTMMCISIL